MLVGRQMHKHLVDNMVDKCVYRSQNKNYYYNL